MTTATPEALVLSDIGKRYPTAGGETIILRHLSLTVATGETVAVIGPSGAGKSTLLHLAGALDRPTSGSVHLGDLEVSALEGKALATFRAHKVGFIFQHHLLLPQLTALENVLLPTLAAKGEANAPLRARTLLEQVGVAHRMEAFPAQLSGGECQRVAIARALINRPALLLADEPTGNLDRDAGANIVTLFLDLAREEGATVVMVTHNLELASAFARCLTLRDGALHPVALATGEGGVR